MSTRCPACATAVFAESLTCPTCSAEIAFHPPSQAFVLLDREEIDIAGSLWAACLNRGWRCNWLARVGEESSRCMSCRLVRRRPDSDDTLALERLAEAAQDMRRLLKQLFALGLPVIPGYERPGGLAFDMLSSFSGDKVVIGHADGVITIDLAESLDSYREEQRIRLGEAYRTMLGHFRHEIGHYYQDILVVGDAAWGECRELFGDERVDYDDAIARHYEMGAPTDWVESYISEYATMHPWEDFAETFAHYLHITGTLTAAAEGGMVLEKSGVGGKVETHPVADYRGASIEHLLDDWHWVSFQANRVNRAMGESDLYPFSLVEPVRRKLAYMHHIVGEAAARHAEDGSGLPGA